MRIDRLPASAIMAREPVTVQKQHSLAAAWQLMQEHRVRHLPVVHDGWLEGVLSAGDVAAAQGTVADSEHDMRVPIGRVMSTRVFAAERDDSVLTLARMMLIRGLGCVPIIDDVGWLLGLVTASDVVALTGNLLRQRPARSVCEIMRSAPDPSAVPGCGIAPHTPIWTAAQELIDRRTDVIAVVDGDRGVGRVTSADILRLLVSDPDISGDQLDHRDVPVNYYMSSPVRTIAPSAAISIARRLLDSYRISSLLVCEGQRVVGIVSRTDLIGVADEDMPVSSLMSTGVIEIDIATPLIDACRTMIEREVHQLVVRQHQRPVGVLSRSDCVAAVRDLRLASPARGIATPVAFTISADQSRVVADSLLDRAELGSLLVVDGDHPVGVYGPRERLRRYAPGEWPIDNAMSAQIITVPGALSLFRVAAQMVATGAECAVVLDRHRHASVLTPSDFVRALADLAGAASAAAAS